MKARDDTAHTPFDEEAAEGIGATKGRQAHMAGESEQTCQLDVSALFERSPEPTLVPADSNQTGVFYPADTQHQEGDDKATDVRPPSAPTHSTAPREPVLEGVDVPGYEILAELGRGGMGVVYKARHVRLQRLVALKMILAGAHAGAAGLARFRAEAEAVAQLQHPNIVQIYETGEHEGRPYFSLEFVEGGSLEQRMQESPLTPKATAELIETLARTMDMAHQRGIVHRDLKPANILLGAASGGQSMVLRTEQLSALSSNSDNWSRTVVPKIADFGLAKKVNAESSGQTQSGTILGTPSYMSPEQAEGNNDLIGPATDIYALGALCYEMLTGRPPFKAGNPIDTIRQVIEQEPVPPRQLEPRTPPDLETICLKCLEKDPTRRYATSLALAEDIRRFLHDEPIQARPTPAWERAWKWGKRRPAVVALLGVSVLAVVGMVLLIIWHNASLRLKLDKALAEERLAREREQEALESQRLARVEAEGQKLLHDGKLAVAARDWVNARLHLTQALATVGTEERLENLREPAETLLKQVEQELRIEAERRASQTRFQQFGKLRDEAQFLGTLFTGMDLAANLKATQTVVAQALELYSVSMASPVASAPGVADAYLSAAQKAEILADCYQLVLIRAETEAQAAGELKGAARDERLRAALRVLEDALRFGQPSRAYHLRRARYLNQLGDKTAAAQAEKAATDAAVLHVLDHFLVADELYRRASFDEAIKAFDLVLQRKPDHFWAQYLNALCLLRRGRPAEARAQLSACLAQRADFVWLYLLRGFAQSELQAFDGAEADFATALQMPLDDFARYVLLVNRGVMRVRRDQLDEAIGDLNTAIKIRPNDYQAHVNLALAYRRGRQLDLALAELSRAAQLEPGLAQIYRLRARLHLERKSPALALKDFEQSIQRESPDSPFLVEDHVERGRLLLQERKPTEALASFDAALKLRKDHSLGQRLRAETLFQLGRFQEVVTAFDRYLETGKPLESVYRGRGLARAERGQYPGAIEDYTKALELAPSSVVFTYRGWAHLVCDAPKLAQRDFQLAIELDANNADAHTGRGLVLASQNQPREASRDAEAALRLGKQTPRLLYNAARIFAQCGRESEASSLDLLRQALELLPVEQRAAFWVNFVQKDGALQAIRMQSRYRQLEAEYSSRP